MVTLVFSVNIKKELIIYFSLMKTRHICLTAVGHFWVKMNGLLIETFE